VWLIGVMVCLLAALWVQLSVSAGNGWPHNALRHHWLMPISCHFRDCKALLVTSLTHVSGAIASVQTFTFTFIGLTVIVTLELCAFALAALQERQLNPFFHHTRTMRYINLHTLLFYSPMEKITVKSLIHLYEIRW